MNFLTSYVNFWVNTMKQSPEKPELQANASDSKKALTLRKPRKLKAGEALKELVSKKRVLPACESSSACSRMDQ